MQYGMSQLEGKQRYEHRARPARLDLFEMIAAS
jgi:hypothetical protein